MNTTSAAKKDNILVVLGNVNFGMISEIFLAFNCSFKIMGIGVKCKNLSDVLADRIEIEMDFGSTVFIYLYIIGRL